MTTTAEKAAAAYLTFEAHLDAPYLANAISEAKKGITNEIAFWLQMDEDSSDEEDVFEFEDMDPEEIRLAVVRATEGKTLARIREASSPSYNATFDGYLAA